MLAGLVGAADDARMAASGGALDEAELPPIDVLLVVALEAALDAVLAEGGGANGWREVHDHVHVRTRVARLRRA